MNNIENIRVKSEGESPEKGSKDSKEKTSPKWGCKTLIIVLIFTLVFGGLSGAGAVVLLANQGQGFLKKLGIEKEVKIPTTETKKIVVEESSAVVDSVEKVKPAVVSVVAKKEVQGFFGQTQTQQVGGTGFILTADGLIATNKHVVSQDLNYQVFLNDGTKYSATVESTDPFNDLAFLKIKADNLPVLELGSSEELKVGQYVIAIGNALGEFQNSVTLGVLSAKQRDLQAQGIMGETSNFENLLQTDAAINQGNSGGPLVNLEGQVVGVNVAKAEQAENVGFAIPSDVLASVLESYQEYGKIVRPFLGVRYVQLTPEISRNNDLPVDRGAIIYSGDLKTPAVVNNSPADKVGLGEDDIITKLNDQKIDAQHSLAGILQTYSPGDKVAITYLREGNEHKAEVTLARHDKFE